MQFTETELNSESLLKRDCMAVKPNLYLNLSNGALFKESEKAGSDSDIEMGLSDTKESDSV